MFSLRGLTLLFCTALVGFILGLAATFLIGLANAFQIPALSLAISRALFVAKHVFSFLQSLGLHGFQILVFSVGVGIFLNNSMVAMIILLAPLLIIKAKLFSDKYLGRIYQRYRLWIFKPIGWKTYKILAAIFPLYALALQFYLIGGTILTFREGYPGLLFLALELSAIMAACTISIQPSMSRNPLEEASRYLKRLRVAAPAILTILFAAAIIEAHQLLSTIG